MQLLIRKNWSPYVSGTVIGLLQIPLILLLGKTLGVSSALSVGVYHVHTFFLQDIFCVGTLNAHIWQIGLVLGIILGAYVSSRLSKTQRPPIAALWKTEFGIKSKKVRYMFSFMGGILLILGARISNGCTSGNGISGTSQLDASSWLVLIAMFTSVILVTHLLRFLLTRKGK